MSTFLTGRFGEDAAVKFLIKNGYTILERNYRAANGEIDVVAIKDKKLSFVEVKSRKNTDFGYPAEAVTLKKQKKIIDAAKVFLLRFQDYNEISFDVCEVYLKERRINYIENAFCLE